MDVFLISFVALPFVFEAWLRIGEEFQQRLRGKLWMLSAVLLFYIFGIVAMVWGNSKLRQREVARDQIIGYLTTKNFKMMSFERIRSNINRYYSDEFLGRLPVYFPEVLRRAAL